MQVPIRSGTSIGQVAPSVARAAPLATEITTIETTSTRLQSLLHVAESGQVNWLAGKSELYSSYQSAMGAGRSTAVGREGFDLLRKRLSTRITLEGPIHHWKYPITQYGGEALNAENLYLTRGASHLQLHRATGLEGAPFRMMALGSERELQSMFNFWLSAGPK